MMADLVAGCAISLVRLLLGAAAYVTHKFCGGTDKGSSYRQPPSNIAVLEEHHQSANVYNLSFSLYIEGIGTTDEETDSLIAAGLGIGATGIIDKVNRAIDKIIAKILTKVPCDEQIDLVHLDCFGFSRGAAAARTFIHEALVDKKKSLKLRLQRAGRNVHEVKVRFVGLYDTVAAYGVDQDNDTAAIYLDAIRQAEYVVQLAAADEHRKKFPLTNINSACNGVQIFLPGAHSDIGGGYADNMDEVNLQVLDLDTLVLSQNAKAAVARERQWLLEYGWFSEEEIQDVNLWHELKVTRKGIRNCYALIPLKMVADYARGKGVGFVPELCTDYSVPPDLQEVADMLQKSLVSYPEYWSELNTQTMKALRHKYLHFSAFYGSKFGCNEPQFTENDPIGGRRKRRILYG